MSAKQFASQGDMEDKEVSFVELAEGVYAYTAEGDPNAGIVIGPESVLVIEALATPIMAQRLIDKVHEITDKPIKHLFLTHYHAVRVLGASAFAASEIITSADTRDLIEERGQQDFDSEAGRFPRLFRGIDSVPGLTWPTQTFVGKMTLWLGEREVCFMQLGRGHTKGDAVVWLPQEKVLFGGDLIENEAALYTGDAYHEDWPTTLDNLKALEAEKIVPGRGDCTQNKADCDRSIEMTRTFLNSMYFSVKAGAVAGRSLAECYKETYALLQPKYGDWPIFEHCLPFNISRCYDEALGMRDPQIWTAERDQEMWHALQAVVEN